MRLGQIGCCLVARIMEILSACPRQTGREKWRKKKKKRSQEDSAARVYLLKTR